MRISRFRPFVVLCLLRSYRTFLIHISREALMYQFQTEDTALQAARLLAVYERAPILVMARGMRALYTIGPLNNAAVHHAGQHMATVYRSGRVDYMGLT
jgi:hypothetical protein